MKRGNIVEAHCSKVKALRAFSNFLKTGLVTEVFADTEPATSDNDEPESDKSTTPTINYEDLISKARAEEKKKQYTKIEGLNAQVNTLTQQHNDDLLIIAQLREDVKTAKEKLSKAGEGDSETITTLKGEISTLEADKKELETKLKNLEENTVDRETLENEIRAEMESEYKTKTYKAEKMAEYKDDILVPELVVGDTIEEIDASIKLALEKSKAIREKLGISDKGEPDNSHHNTNNGRTPKSPSNPSVSRVQDNQYSMEYIASLDVTSPEYAEVRKKLGLR